MGCFINDLNGNTDFYEFAYPKSPRYLAYLIGGLLLMVFIVAMKSVLVFRFDWIKAKFNYQHGRANYNYSNYIIGNTYHIIGNLLLAALTNHHFYFFNMIFSSTQPTCVGSSVSFSHTDYMFNHNSTVITALNIVHLITSTSPAILHRANVAAIPNDLQHLINKIH